MVNPKTGTQISIQYQRAHGFLKPVRVTVVGADVTGILWPDVKRLGDAFGDNLIRVVELAFDFAPDSGVDKRYVLRHALFGKSQPVDTGRYPDRLRYGARQAAKLVRCYWKREVDAFRVELELHSQFANLPETDCLLFETRIRETDFRFVYVRWHALDSHLARKGKLGNRIAQEARIRYTSIHSLLDYLRSVGVNNVHRFVRTSKLDAVVRKAFETWRFSMTPRERNRRHREPETES